MHATTKRCATGALLLALALTTASADAAPGAGSIRGRVIGPDGQPMAGVPVSLKNDITGFSASTVTAQDGTFRFLNVPLNPYSIGVDLQGFRPARQDVDVRSSVPLDVTVAVQLAGVAENVTVTAQAGTAKLETTESSSHVDIDKSYIQRAAAPIATRAMEELITATPGFSKDENGRYHFQGAHSQGQFVVDGQTISDQTGVTFSNSIDPGIAQSLEVIYGNVPAEYGEKVGTVVNLVTKSGLATPFRAELFGGASSFDTYEAGVSLSGGSRSNGVFASFNGSWSDRFLDPVNPDNLHNTGNTGRAFVRFDHASESLSDQVRVTALLGRTHRDVPNTYTQESAGQDQRVESLDQNYNLSWTHVLSSRMTFDANAFTRLADFKLRPSVNDTPVTALSDRSLDNYGANATFVWASGPHQFKAGGVVKRFPIRERFSFGITDPGLNDPESEDYNPDLAPYDLTRGGTLLEFRERQTGTYAAGFVQDTMKYKRLTANVGLRYDHNDLPTSESQWEPRLGVAYYLPRTGSVFRASYNRVFYTPLYENILFSSSDLAASLVPPAVKDSRELGGGVLAVPSERQNAYTLGVQQALGPSLRLDADVWWRRSRNAGDQDQFLNTGIVFPLAFDAGRFNGWDVRLDLARTQGVAGFISLGHVHAIYEPPPVGGLFLDQEAVESITEGPFLIDHDQALQLQGQLSWDIAQSGVWVGTNIRYDSGLVTDASPEELLLDPDNAFAAPFVRVHSGTPLDPNRIESRTLTSFSAGYDLAQLGIPVSVQADVLNAFDVDGVYNIVSVFGGTHVIPPRTFAVRARYRFGQ